MDADETNGKKESSQSKLQEELSNIQIQLTLIEAIEARNEAQIYSFVDEQDQWESMDEEDRLLLQSKLLLEERRDDIESELELR